MKHCLWSLNVVRIDLARDVAGPFNLTFYIEHGGWM